MSGRLRTPPGPIPHPDAQLVSKFDRLQLAVLTRVANAAAPLVIPRRSSGRVCRTEPITHLGLLRQLTVTGIEPSTTTDTVHSLLNVGCLHGDRIVQLDHFGEQRQAYVLTLTPRGRAVVDAAARIDHRKGRR